MEEREKRERSLESAEQRHATELQDRERAVEDGLRVRREAIARTEQEHQSSLEQSGTEIKQLKQEAEALKQLAAKRELAVEQAEVDLETRR